MEMERSERLTSLPRYLFADLRSKIAAAKKEGRDVINLGIGDPDIPTPAPVVEELIEKIDDAGDPVRHRYGCDVPVEDLRRAFCDYYRRRWDVALDREDVVPTMGSKDAIARLPMALMNPGDTGIAPVPGYPTYNIGFVFSSCETHYVPLRKENDYLVDFSEIPPDVATAAKILWLNYPNNPTTAIAPLSFFAEAVAFGREHGILICHDNAYCANTYDGYKAPSILQVDGAADTAVEFFSLSKAFCMTGWRVGCMAGNRSAVGALETVKENVDNGTLRAVQFAAVRALDGAAELTPLINEVFRKRRDLVVEKLNAAGWTMEKPKATIYVWAPVPERYGEAESPSGAYAADLLEKKDVVVTPGRGYGPTGEGYFRISLTYPDEILTEAVSRMADMEAEA